MGYNKAIEIESLIGEVLTHIDTDDSDQILLTTESGRQILIHHYQDCCETVKIEDTEGKWHELIGKPILMAKHDVYPSGDPPPEYQDSWTRTTLTFKVNDATVISKWIGESNGYYSESVDLEEIVNGKNN